MQTLSVTFPPKTAKQLVEECKNKVENGKLLYNTDWYKDELFYTTDKCRKGKRTVTLELQGLDKTWNECDTLVKEQGGEMLNFAEIVYLLREYPEVRKVLDWNWTWTAVRNADGRLVCVGDADASGANVNGNGPRRAYGHLGVLFSRSGTLKAGKVKTVPETDLEARVKALEVRLDKYNLK